MERNPFRSLERQFENLQRQFEAMGEACGTGNSSTFRKQVSPPPDSRCRYCRSRRRVRRVGRPAGTRKRRYRPSALRRHVTQYRRARTSGARCGRALPAERTRATGHAPVRPTRNRSTKTPSRRRARTASSVTYPRRNRPLSREQRSTSRRGGRRDVFVPYDGSYPADAARPRDRVRAALDADIVAVTVIP